MEYLYLYLYMMTRLVHRVYSVVVYRAVETKGALLFMQMEKVFRSYCASTIHHTLS